MGSKSSTAINKFVRIARRYCAWAEASAGDPRQEMRQARELLAELHLAVLKLPETEFGESQRASIFNINDWKEILERFRNLPVDVYWDVFDPLAERESLWNSLANDLADIYSDVKSDLLLFDAGHKDEAVWQWRFNFLIHWGRHLTSAQRAIHSYFDSNQLEEF